MKTISVLGCGWLGLPLAAKLVKEGHSLKGSTTGQKNFPKMEQEGIRPVLLTYSPQRDGLPGKFFDSDILFLNIPFKRDLDDPFYYKQQIEAVLKDAKAGGVSFVIFASSTSVYDESINPATEEASLVFSNNRIRALHETEQMILADASFDGTVVRFGGLVGGKRRPGSFLAGRRKLGSPDKPVNLIHLEDCIGIVETIINADARGEIFNAVCDGHPTRKELYTAAADKMGLETPRFENEGKGPYKTVSNDKIKQVLKYRFKRPAPKDFI